MQLQQATLIANKLVELLQPHCTIIHIAGSIRRQKPEVKDIEIVCLPKTIEIPQDLFGDKKTIERVPGFINAIVHNTTAIKGSISEGKYIQRRVYSLEPRLPEDINLDIFIPDDFDYYRQYAIRTGSADYAMRVIATGWRKIGWCGSDQGLRPTKDCIKKNGVWKCLNPNAEKPPHWQSEQQFFAWIKTPWIEPSKRI